MYDIILAFAEIMIELSLATTHVVLVAIADSAAFLPIAVVVRPQTVVTIEGRIGACGTGGRPTMYTLSNAKDEIDSIAKHALDIAAHALAIDAKLDAKLENFKQDLLARIDAKFAAFEKTVLGETLPSETSAVSDLAAKVALLKQNDPAAASHQDSAPDHDGHHQDNGWQGEHQHHG